MKTKTDFTVLPFTRFRITDHTFRQAEVHEVAAPNRGVAALFCQPYGFNRFALYIEEIPGKVTEEEKTQINDFLNEHFVVVDIKGSPAEIIAEIENGLMQYAILNSPGPWWEAVEETAKKLGVHNLTKFEYQSGVRALRHKTEIMAIQHDGWALVEEEADVRELNEEILVGEDFVSEAEAKLILFQLFHKDTIPDMPEMEVETPKTPEHEKTIYLALMLATLIGLIFAMHAVTRVAGLTVFCVGVAGMLLAWFLFSLKNIPDHEDLD